MHKFIIYIVTFIMSVTINFGAVIASDSGSNYGGDWLDQENQGPGFAAWNLGGGGSHSHYIGDKAAGSTSWGMSAWDGGYAFAYRDFNAAMKAGDTFSLVFGNNGGVDNAGNIGFTLRDFSNQDVWSFRFLSGGTGYYQIRGDFTGGDENWFNTSIGYHDNTPITINFTYQGNQKYDISMSGGGDNYSGSNYDLSNAGAATDFYAFNNNSGHDMSFDNMKITDNSGEAVPEPTTFAMIGIAMAVLMGARRKKTKC